MMPIANNGAAIVYNNLIKPFIKRHEKNIEKAFTIAGDIAKDVGKEGQLVIKCNWLNSVQLEHLLYCKLYMRISGNFN